MTRKKVDTIEEVTNGELLSVNDFMGMHTTRFDANALGDLNSYILKTKKFPRYNSDGTLRHNVEFICIQIEMPILKECIVKELARKWSHPQYYIAAIYEHKDRYRGRENYSPRLYFEKIVMQYAKAIELYKQLVYELLSLFKEEDREAAKSKMMCGVVGEHINHMSRDLAYGLQDDIAGQKKDFGIANIPQNLIDTWTDLCNIVDAWIAEIQPYRKEQQLYRHNKDLEDFKSGKISIALTRHPDLKNSLDQWYIYPRSYILNNFLKERALALNLPVPQGETINVKMHPSTMTFVHATQMASRLWNNAFTYNSATENSESVKLLDKLEGYKAKYCAPKAVSISLVDAEIILQEKLIVRSLVQVDRQDVAGLLDTTQSAIKLLSLIHMRYKISLETKNDDTYFAFFKSVSLIDKENYYDIFSFYLENIFQHCLTPLLKLISPVPDVYSNEFKQTTEAVCAIIDFCYDLSNVDSTSAKRAIKVLSEIKKLSGHESTINEANNLDEDTNLRHRKSIKVSPT